MIEICDVSASYEQEGGRQAVLDHVDLKLETGKIYALIGPSGCGKSTLLKIVAGLLPAASGSVRMDGRAIAPNTNRIGYVQQHYGLLDWATVYENAVLGLRIKKDDLRTKEENVRFVLDRLGLTPFLNKYPGQLSGGERQRVSVARAFLLEPDVLLMDEPFSALDAINREKLQDLLLSVWQERPVSALFVTHSIEEAIFVGQYIVIMTQGPGKIAQVLENPLFGLPGLRMRQEYHDMTVELRKAVGAIWD